MFFLVSSLSPSQLCTLKTTAALYHDVRGQPVLILSSMMGGKFGREECAVAKIETKRYGVSSIAT